MDCSDERLLTDRPKRCTSTCCLCLLGNIANSFIDFIIRHPSTERIKILTTEIRQQTSPPVDR